MTGLGEHLFELHSWLERPQTRVQCVALRSMAICHGIPLAPTKDFLDCLAAGLGTLKPWKEKKDA